MVGRGCPSGAPVRHWCHGLLALLLLAAGDSQAQGWRDSDADALPRYEAPTVFRPLGEAEQATQAADDSPFRRQDPAPRRSTQDGFRPLTTPLRPLPRSAAQSTTRNTDPFFAPPAGRSFLPGTGTEGLLPDRRP